MKTLLLLLVLAVAAGPGEGWPRAGAGTGSVGLGARPWKPAGVDPEAQRIPNPGVLDADFTRKRSPQLNAVESQSAPRSGRPGGGAAAVLR